MIRHNSWSHPEWFDAPGLAAEPWTDPKPWVTPGGRVAHPLPQTIYRKEPRTKEQFDAEQEANR